MNKDSFERLLSEFSSTIGLPELSFDEDGMAYLTVDDNHPIIFRRDDARGCLVLLGQVADTLPTHTDATLWSDMLAMGLKPLRNGEPGMGADLDSGQVLIHQSLPLAELHVAQLVDTFFSFIDLQMVWAQRLEASRLSEPQAPSLNQSSTWLSEKYGHLRNQA
ncbi:hypothetical protein EO087_05365 [Dyella sp. M7H15-1]|uniref:CesT family type III secretion system chaperone n=1 Tax=Dyella sp. M7H15-1 TaxID=2501295 RepID=UPI001004FE1A|nr:CesT family type III secretion system chaperone [Dyella sp. M7H15-1]QAU23479.1 hypothetical protein EO087_05365 [Dyella sp. M7H15-1]